MKEVRLADVCLNMHQGINTVADKIEYQSTGIPIIQSKNITSGFLDLDDVKYVEEAKYDFYKNKYNPQKDDILVCNIGTIGKSLLIQNSDRFLIAWNLFLLKIDTSILYPAYLKQYLDVLNKKNYFNKFLTGGTVKFINKKTMGEIKIPLPPLEEQKHIAAVLSKAEVLIAERKQSIQLLDEYLKSTFLEMFGDPVKNEKGWEKVLLKDYCTKIGSGSTPRGGKESYFEEGISLIRSLNVHNDQFLMKDLAHIDDKQAHDLRNVIIEFDDVLLNITGASVARCCIVPKEILPARVNQHVSILRTIKNELTPLFLNRLITNDSFQKFLIKTSRSKGATREAITKEELETLKIILPPFKVQTQFAQIVEKTEALKAQYKTHLQELEQLYGALSQRAFRGEMNIKEIKHSV